MLHPTHLFRLAPSWRPHHSRIVHQHVQPTFLRQKLPCCRPDGRQICQIHNQRLETASTVRMLLLDGCDGPGDFLLIPRRDVHRAVLLVEDLG